MVFAEKIRMNGSDENLRCKLAQNHHTEYCNFVATLRPCLMRTRKEIEEKSTNFRTQQIRNAELMKKLQAKWHSTSWNVIQISDSGTKFSVQ